MLTTTDQASGLVAAYTYNVQNQPTSEEESNPTAGLTSGPTTASTYNAAGELTSTTDANGNMTFYTYDALGRQTSATVPQTPTLMPPAYDNGKRPVRPVLLALVI